VRAEVEARWPNEAVGLLLGRRSDRIEDIAVLTNVHGQPHRSLRVRGSELAEACARAQAQGLQCLGTWHSHPDRTALLSPADRRMQQPGDLMLVIAIHREGVTAVRAHLRRGYNAIEIPVVLEGPS
jgi:proteasome lid subunit RPN8/RPN11